MLPNPAVVPVKIIYVPWLIPAWARAQTWCSIILVKRGVALSQRLLAHELAHVLQWRALGVWGFLSQYARHHLRYGYEQNPLEVAARAAEQDEFFLSWAKGIPDYRARLAQQTKGQLPA